MMNVFVDIFSRSMRWVYRFRKRCGYGIHSPFAFNLVTGVIYEDGEYYSYHDLSLLRSAENTVLREKDDRLLFRLVNHIEPSNGIIIGNLLGVTLDYLHAGRHQADWYFHRVNDVIGLRQTLEQLSTVHFVYIDALTDAGNCLNLIDEILPYTCDKTLIVIRGIHSSKTIFSVWQYLLTLGAVRVSMDLHDFGLLYFEKRLNKENYVINYY